MPPYNIHPAGAFPLDKGAQVPLGWSTHKLVSFIYLFFFFLERYFSFCSFAVFYLLQSDDERGGYHFCYIVISTN